MLVPSANELNTVRRLVHGTDSEILRPANQKDFDKMLSSVRAGLGGPRARLDSPDMALLAAICILAPQPNCRDLALLPHCAALAGLVGAVPGDSVRERRRIAIDCAIAYGCGWGRTPRSTRDFGLEELWETAFHLLVKQICDAIAVANHLLAGILQPLLDPAEMPMLQDLENDAWVSGSILAFRLIRPLHSSYRAAGKLFEIAANVGATNDAIAADAPSLDYCKVAGPGAVLVPLPAGARYVFEVDSGTVLAEEDERALAAGPGGRFVVRAGDFGATEVSFPVDFDLARMLRLDRGDCALVSAAADPASLGQWECGCGSWACPERHRLVSWRPDTTIGLKDFVNSAINGRDFPLKPKSFIAGMYYAYLSREGWGAQRHTDSAPLPRVRRVLMVRSTQLLNSVTGAFETREDLRENFLLLSQICNFRPTKVVRCAACLRFRKWGDDMCDCGANLPHDAPTVVWRPVPPTAPALPGAVVPIVPPTTAPAAPPSPVDVSEDVERSDVEHPMERFLKEWDERIEKTEHQEENAGPAPISDSSDSDSYSEERRWYQATEDAYRRGDLIDAANLIMGARKKGWKLPKVEYDDD